MSETTVLIDPIQSIPFIFSTEEFDLNYNKHAKSLQKLEESNSFKLNNISEEHLLLLADKAIRYLIKGVGCDKKREKLTFFNKSENLFRKTYQLKSINGVYNSSYAVLLGELGRLSEAEEHYKIAIKLDPNNALIHNSFAILLKNLKQFSKAEEHYKIALIHDLYNGMYHYNYAILLNELEKFSEAEKHYKISIKLDPNNAVYHHNYAILLKNLDRFLEAKKHYKAAIFNDLNTGMYHYSYAISLEEFGRTPEADGHYKAAINVDPKNAKYHYNYGMFLGKLNRYTESEEHLYIALNKDQSILNTYTLIIIELKKLSQLHRKFDRNDKKDKIVFDKLLELAKEELNQPIEKVDYQKIISIFNICDIKKFPSFIENDSNIAPIIKSSKKQETHEREDSLVDKYRKALDSSEVKLTREITKTKNREEVFKTLLNHASESGEVSISTREIAKEIKLTSKEVSREINKLLDCNKIICIKESAPKKSRIYKIISLVT